MGTGEKPNVQHRFKFLQVDMGLGSPQSETF